MPKKSGSKGSVGDGIMDEGAASFIASIREGIQERAEKAAEHLQWLKENMPPYFFITSKEDREAFLNLISSLDQVPKQKRLLLLDQDKKFILARSDRPGSLYQTLRHMQDQKISYAEMTHSLGLMPGGEDELEIQKYEFALRTPQEIAQAPLKELELPQGLLQDVRREMKRIYPDYEFDGLESELRLLVFNNPVYVKVSPPERVARLLWLYLQGRKHGGLFLNAEKMKSGPDPRESRVMFAVGNPPKSGFLAQAMETFTRLGIGVRRFYALVIENEYHSYFMGNFYVTAYDQQPIDNQSKKFVKLKKELYNTQILSADSEAYRRFVPSGVLTGEEASLTNAFISFCHTTLAHNQPDRFDLSEVQSAFLSHPEMIRSLIELFRVRFKPGLESREEKYAELLEDMRREVADFNTGHRRLDSVRRTIYRTCLLFIDYTLKTNFFVPEKHALAFRMNPAYLDELGAEFIADLPPDKPFRVTFFFGRHGIGYHIGFSDIARGGWRTVICRDEDAYITNTNNLFREVYVLAHTQHLKNKDIYEGGSKLTVAMDATDLEEQDYITQRMYKLQYGLTNAFLDLFITEDGHASDPRVVDYYQDDEPIEIGPDENMHDAMIEQIAYLAQKRGYVLGKGIMSSKSVGINHKDYGVTSLGVMRFAEIAMAQAGIDIRQQAFDIKMTGGPWGDVAGNAMNLIIERCPKARILTITDGTAALYDPKGANRKELKKHLLKNDLEAFSPEALSEGGYMVYRGQTKKDNLRLLYKKVIRTAKGLEEHWITQDEQQREFGHLLFGVEPDLFMPCGGRPETIDDTNWQQFLLPDGRLSAGVIVEGANSFIVPEARAELQKAGAILLRDASANKCGVISSSYEIIANLLMSDNEFLKRKSDYVKDVLFILEKRAAEEAELIFKRHREAGGKKLYSDISMELSRGDQRPLRQVL